MAYLYISVGDEKDSKESHYKCKNDEIKFSGTKTKAKRQLIQQGLSGIQTKLVSESNKLCQKLA